MRVWRALTVISLGGTALLACSLVVGVGDYSSGGTAHVDGGTGQGACGALATCCPAVPSSEKAACQTLASAANEPQCLQQLMQYEMAGDCNEGTCAKPPKSVPSQFTPPTGVLPRSCTDTDVLGWATCLVGDLNHTDSGEPDCDVFVQGADGGPSSCGLCLTGPTVSPAQMIPSAWGAWIAVNVYGIVGEATTLHEVSLGPSLSSCLAATATNKDSQSCANAALANEACALYVCLPLCAVASVADEAAFAGCLTATAAGACAMYNSETLSNCMKPGAQGPYDTCNTLATETSNATGTVAQQAEFLALVCGTFDAGL